MGFLKYKQNFDLCHKDWRQVEFFELLCLGQQRHSRQDIILVKARKKEKFKLFGERSSHSSGKLVCDHRVNRR